MIFQGDAISVELLDDGIAELKFDLKGESVNKFNKQTILELKDATDALKSNDSVKGLIATSGKDVFIVGADITEFGEMFAGSEDQLIADILATNEIFSGVEDLPFPTVTAINGIALGGGFEFCLSTDYRVMSSKAKVGLPEVKLGLFPGFGGTVRLSRVMGADNAIEIIAAGKTIKAPEALKNHAVDGVVSAEKLGEAARKILKSAIDGAFGSFDDFKATFAKAAATRFGSASTQRRR